jgi:hypothetical protein
MPRNLILAYAAAWLIHGLYLALLFNKRRKLKVSSHNEEARAKS